jgi:5-methylcytosine-specific restriction protein A
MPSAAPRPCTYAGCGVLVRDGSGRCPAHKQVERKLLDARRGSANERGYTGAWQKARAGFLRSHPLCKACQDVGRVEAAEVVDHIVPHKGDKALFWDHSNWQALSKRCHDIKTAREDGGFGRGLHQPGG